MVKVWKNGPMASLKKGWTKDGPFSNRCLKIGPFSNRCLKIRSIFKHILKQIPLPRARQRPGGAAGGGARGIFSKFVWKWTVFSNICLKMDLFSNICLKMDHIWLILFSNSPLGQFFKISPFNRGRKLPTYRHLTWAQAFCSGFGPPGPGPGTRPVCMYVYVYIRLLLFDAICCKIGYFFKISPFNRGRKLPRHVFYYSCLANIWG